MLWEWSQARQHWAGAAAPPISRPTFPFLNSCILHVVKVFSFWFKVLGFWFLVLGFWFLVFSLLPPKLPAALHFLHKLRSSDAPLPFIFFTPSFSSS